MKNIAALPVVSFPLCHMNKNTFHKMFQLKLMFQSVLWSSWPFHPNRLKMNAKQCPISLSANVWDSVSFLFLLSGSRNTQPIFGVFWAPCQNAMMHGTVTQRLNLRMQLWNLQCVIHASKKEGNDLFHNELEWWAQCLEAWHFIDQVTMSMLALAMLFKEKQEKINLAMGSCWIISQINSWIPLILTIRCNIKRMEWLTSLPCRVLDDSHNSHD